MADEYEASTSLKLIMLAFVAVVIIALTYFVLNSQKYFVFEDDQGVVLTKVGGRAAATAQPALTAIPSMRP